MEEGCICVSISDTKPESDKELSVTAGEVIRYLSSNKDWAFGESLVSKKQGWFDPKLFVRICPPLNVLKYRTFLDRKNDRDAVLNEIISIEKEFTTSQKTFVDIVVKQLLLRDTNFKRSIMNDPSLAVCINLIQDIHNATSIFLQELIQAKTHDKIASCYQNFAPSIQLFAQLTSENSSALNALKQQQKSLNAFMAAHPLPDDLSVEFCFISPLKHFKKYFSQLQSYAVLVDPSEPGFIPLMNALYAIYNQTVDVDNRMKEEESNLQLLNIQNQFSGNATIFKQGRRLIKEGYGERLTNNPTAPLKIYYIHLFNDCLVYSTKKSAALSSTFKLKKVVDLNDINIAPAPDAFMSNVLSITAKNNNSDSVFDLNIAFHFADEAETADWLKLITDQMNALNTKKEGKKQQRVSAATVTTIPGVNPSSLGPRASCVYAFLLAEIPFAESIWQMYNVLIKPLINATKGANLLVGSLNASHEDKTPVHAARRTSVVTRGQASQTTEALQQADIKVFLRAAESLALSLQDFATSIETQAKSSSWSESILVGSIFTSSTVAGLCDQYKSYASGQEATLRVLRGASFTEFYAEAENILTQGNGKLSEMIELTRRRVEFYLKFIRELLLVTPTSNPDYKPLSSALEKLSTQASEVSEVIKNKINFEKLLDIQGSFITVNMFGPDPFVSKIASYDRVFIREGELKKVCRKRNKIFKFWLFNDYLIYGEALGSNTYKFNRNLELAKCTVTECQSDTLQHAFEIFGTEKSFIVIAATAAIQQEWIAAINKAIEAIRPPEVQAATTHVAPLWVPDSLSDKCYICSQAFTLWKRRHHCRQCGLVVCGEHSSHQMILPHISDSKKQRVCDVCFTNKDLDITLAGRNAAANDVSKNDKMKQSAQNSSISSIPASPPRVVETQEKKKWNPKVSTNPFDSGVHDLPLSPPPPVPTSPPPPLPSTAPGAGVPPPKPARMQTQPSFKNQASSLSSPPELENKNGSVSNVSSKLQAFQTKTETSRELSPQKSQGGSSIQSRLDAYKANAQSPVESDKKSMSPSRLGDQYLASKRVVQAPAVQSPDSERNTSPFTKPSAVSIQNSSNKSPTQSLSSKNSLQASRNPPLATSVVDQPLQMQESASADIIINPVSKPNPFAKARRISVVAPGPDSQPSQGSQSSASTSSPSSAKFSSDSSPAPVSLLQSASTLSNSGPPKFPAQASASESAADSQPFELSKRKVAPPPKPSDSVTQSPKTMPGKLSIKGLFPSIEQSESVEKTSTLPVQSKTEEENKTPVAEILASRSRSPPPPPSRPMVKPPMPSSPSTTANLPIVSKPENLDSQSTVQLPPASLTSSSVKSPPANAVPPTVRVVPPPPPPSANVAPPPPPPAGQKSSVVTPPPPPPPPPLSAQRPGPPAPPPPPEPPIPPSQSSNLPQEDDGLGKYRKLKQLMPEAAVRQRMTLDGFSENEIEMFLSTSTISGGNVQSHAQPTPPLSKPQVSEDPELAKYRRLKENLPADAVRQKMRLDGVDHDQIEKFISGETIERLIINKPASKPLGLDLGSVTLKSTPAAPPKPVERRASILSQIQSGASLKKVEKNDVRMKPASAGAGSLLDNLAVEMFKRRMNLRVDEDSDSDASGFSDSDSDSE